jgi:hypothetical protein
MNCKLRERATGGSVPGIVLAATVSAFGAMAMYYGISKGLPAGSG